MASAKRFSNYTATFIHGAAQTLSLTQMESFAVEPNPTKAEIIPGGLVDRAAVLTAGAAPRVRFGTRDLATLFGTVSTSAGLALTGAATFRLQEREDGGTFITGATDETITTTGGFIYVESITATQEDANGAIANCVCIPLWDGSTDPLVHTTGVNFSGVGAPAFVSQFFLGPVYHNSVAIDGITSVTIDCGVNYDAKAFNGDPYAKLGAIVTRTPSISFVTAKADAAAALNVFGNAITSSLACYFWKAVDSGTRVAVATAQHCKISTTSGDWCHDDVSVTGNDDGTVTLKVTPKAALAVSVASAIP